MATTRGALYVRLEALCAAAGFVQSLTPFSFDTMPTGVIDGGFRITVQPVRTEGGFGFSEVVVDVFEIWIARTQQADANAAYRTLCDDLQTLYAAIVRDGAVGGDYAVEDGEAATIEHDNGREFAVGRLALPINYEQQL